MSTGTLAPAFWFQALDDTGVAVAGSLVNFYLSGTSTRQTAYADAALTTPLANPAVCDSAGRLVAYLSATSYKIIVTTPAAVQIGPTVDPVASAGASASAIGEIFVFGANSSASVSVTSYPTGATFDKLHPGTSVFYEDSANLVGTYVLEVDGVQVTSGTLTVALMNLSDGNPDTPVVTCAITSLTGERVRSSAITFGASGSSKIYGIKAKVSANEGFVIGARVIKTA